MKQRFNRADRRVIQSMKGVSEAAATVPGVTELQITERVNEHIRNVAKPAADAVIEQMRSIADDTAKRLLSSQVFHNQLREVIQEAAMDVAKEILAEDMAQLEVKVRAMLAAQWEEAVASCARRMLEEQLAKLRTRILGVVT
jgi:hypothetical protein